MTVLRLVGIVLALVALMAPPATAKIYKSARPGCEKNTICLYWWPELPALPGWHGDEKANVSMGGNGINVLIPDGAVFATTQVMLYGNAVLKSKDPKSKSLEDFIAGDAEQARTDSHGAVTISEAPAVKATNGVTWRTVTYVQPKLGVRERVAFGQEGEYYILLTLRARDQKAYKAAEPDFERLVRTYTP